MTGSLFFHPVDLHYNGNAVRIFRKSPSPPELAEDSFVKTILLFNQDKGSGHGACQDYLAVSEGDTLLHPGGGGSIPM